MCSGSDGCAEQTARAGQDRAVEPGGAHQHLLGHLQPGPLLHVAEAHPAPDPQLHGHPEVDAGDPGVPEPVPAPASGVRQRGLRHRHLPPGPHKAGGRLLHVPLVHRHGGRMVNRLRLRYDTY